MFGPGLAAACHVEHETEEFPADVLDRCIAGRDAAGVNVDQIVPALLQLAARRDLDDRHGGKPVGRAAAGGEDVQRHAGGQLQRAADKIAGRRCRKNQPFLAYPLTRCEHARDRAGA